MISFENKIIRHEIRDRNYMNGSSTQHRICDLIWDQNSKLGPCIEVSGKRGKEYILLKDMMEQIDAALDEEASKRTIK